MIFNAIILGGSGGGNLMVTAPSGATVTAENEALNKIYRRTANEENFAVFKGLANGTWQVYMQMWSDENNTTQISAPIPITINTNYGKTIDFFKATINIAYPAGSTCTCTHVATNKTFEAPDYSKETGMWTFIASYDGVWKIDITDGIRTETTSVQIDSENQVENVTLEYFKATINASYPPNSSCTCTCKETGLELEPAPDTTESWGTHAFIVPYTGTWTIAISANDGSGDTASVETTISSKGQVVDVWPRYTKVLYDAGDECEDVTGGWTAYPQQSTAEMNEDNMYVETGWLSYPYIVTENEIDVSKYNYVYFTVSECGATGDSSNYLVFSIADSDASVPNYLSSLSYGSDKGETTNTTLRLSVGDAKSGHIHIQAFATYPSTGVAYARITKVWLE